MHCSSFGFANFSKAFGIETDASDRGVGAVLLQDGHPLAFVSKALGPKSHGLSTYEKEYMAILIAVDQWRQYLQHAKFSIFTDQVSLTHLSEQRLNTAWQQKVFMKLLGLQYRIVYKKGSENRVADALSRRPSDRYELHAVSAVTPAWLTKVVAGYSTDPKAQQLLAELVLSPDAVPNFQLHSGVLRYKGEIWLGNNAELQQKVLNAFHISPIGGHSGFPVTYHRIKKVFAWSGLKTAVKQFV